MAGPVLAAARLGDLRQGSALKRSTSNVRRINGQPQTDFARIADFAREQDAPYSTVQYSTVHLT
jgi:hypothetical protein